MTIDIIVFEVQIERY